MARYIAVASVTLSQSNKIPHTITISTRHLTAHNAHCYLRQLDKKDGTCHVRCLVRQIRWIRYFYQSQCSTWCDLKAWNSRSSLLSHMQHFHRRRRPGLSGSRELCRNSKRLSLCCRSPHNAYYSFRISKICCSCRCCYSIYKPQIHFGNRLSPPLAKDLSNSN